MASHKGYWGSDVELGAVHRKSFRATARFALTIVMVLAVVSGCARRQSSRPTPATSAGSDPTRALHTEASSPVPRSGTGLPNVGVGSRDSTPMPQVYVVERGDTLSSIASRLGCSLEALIEANQITDPNSLRVGQRLRVPTLEAGTGPDTRLLPDSEFVDGPAYVDFDLAAFCAQQGGYINEYYENVGGQVLSGPEIVLRTVQHFSIGPRLLLAVLELKSGWVTDPSPEGAALAYPMGRRGSGWELFSRQLEWAADKLNKGYYDWRGRGMSPVLWDDETATQYAPTLNAATAGLQYFLSLNTTQSDWETWVGEGPESFAATYERLFGDAAEYAIEPLVPEDTPLPTLSLPWSEGDLWYYTGGPHGGWGDGSGWAALDFVPDEGYLGCQVASSFATAAAPGLVIHSQDGEVIIDLDEDGHQETGWVLFYLHVANKDRIPVGSRVERGDPIGHPSCEGGFAQSTHLHFARLFNGEWIAADGPLPLVMSGWQFYSSDTAYEGRAEREGQERTACECWDASVNGLVADR